MNNYLNPPYLRYIKTETGKITKEALIFEIEQIGNDIYVVWEEINYGQVARFKERVVATANTLEELESEKKQIHRRF